MKKYKVTQEFMEELDDWRERLDNGEIELNSCSFYERVDLVEQWRYEPNSKKERYERFGALLNWINGEDVFEVGTPKYIVKRKGIVSIDVSKYLCITQKGNMLTVSLYNHATRFDDFNEASGWANKHFEVVEVDE